MATLYIVTLYNRFSEHRETEYYLNKANAEARVAEVANIFAEAEAKGGGLHWGNVVYNKKAYIEEIKTED